MKEAGFPLKDQAQVEAALRELGEPEADIEALTPAVMALDAWQVEASTPASRQKLLEALMPAMPEPENVPSVVQQAVARRWESQLAQLEFFLDVARAQVSVLRPGFWFFSILIVLLGMVLTTPEFNIPDPVILWLVTPVVALVGIHYGFQSVIHRVSELEAAAPISPLRLSLARLMIVLIYDILLLSAFSLFLISQGEAGGSLTDLILHFLSPLLLVSGVALTCSLRWSMRVSLTVGYTVWMVFVMAMLNLVSAAGWGTLAEWGGMLAGAGLLAVGIMGQRRSPAQML
ncbi:MAG TPA: hypothetical protein PKW33_15910 [Anaerolineaceae bacterium]|nr:hypothetical protein [Anaerolineaceae bacterium]HPN53082.1 hypothetical protein [Anaerolineaceae bacterium]